MAKLITGVDLGAGHLKLVLGDGNRITDVKVTNLPDNLVRDGKILSYDALAAVIKQERFACKDAALTLHSSQCYTRRVSMPAMSVKELKLNLPFEFQDHIEEGADKYRFDYAVLGTMSAEDGTPQEFDLLGAVVRKQLIENCTRMLKKSGMRLKTAAPDVCGFMNIIKRSPNPEDDFCFIDMSCDETRVYLFPKGRYEVTRILEFGSHSLASQLANDLSVDFALARTYLYSNYENCQYRDSLQNAYDNFSMEIERIINFFNFTYRESELRCAYYGGTSSCITPLVSTLEQNLGIDTHSVSMLIPHDTAVDSNVLMQCPAAAGLTLE